ncbi:MAG: ATP-dependent Clp protease ATP-binding subunit ClpX [Lachnospiraceae bacterium]|nr:ATP-dependent Clp protease ATP-binding subunit ClpX [Lachnospiraceae bacterium]
MEDNQNNGYEEVCAVCRRTESVAGKMIQLQKDFCICKDCLQKSFDMINEMSQNGQLDDLTKMMQGMPLTGMPNIPGMNLNPGNDSGAENSSSNEEKKDGGKEGEKKDGDKKDAGEEKKSSGSTPLFLNLGSIFGGQNPNLERTRIKKKERKKDEPLIDINKVPAPHKIKAMLDEYIIGQEKAKKIISVAVYNHYKRVATNTMDEIEIEKSNILMLGPTGCGKTYLVKTLAKLLDVPLAIADATSLTEAGYIGDDIESVLSKLLMAADNDVERAESGIVFVDEIDKLAKKQNTNSRDVSGESVQQGMLKLLEGADIEVPVGSTSKNAMVPLTTVNTRNILFICGGAFPDMEEIIKARLSKQTSIGFNGELKDKYDKEKNLLNRVTVEDVKKFGMIPEFVGRLPILCPMEELTEDMLVEILKEPKNAILKQYQKLLELDEVELIFDDSALHAIARKAMERDTGARALRAVIEEFMLDIMYEIPKDDNIGRVTLTGDFIEGKGGPIVEIRTGEKTKKIEDTAKKEAEYEAIEGTPIEGTPVEDTPSEEK